MESENRKSKRMPLLQKPQMGNQEQGPGGMRTMTQEQNTEIRYQDLSPGLRTFVTIGWVIIALNLLAFLVGFVGAILAPMP